MIPISSCNLYSLISQDMCYQKQKCKEIFTSHRESETFFVGKLAKKWELKDKTPKQIFAWNAFFKSYCLLLS